mgnify:CR=1 FL=1
MCNTTNQRAAIKHHSAATVVAFVLTSILSKYPIHQRNLCCVTLTTRGGFLGEGWSFSILYIKWTVLHPTPFHQALLSVQNRETPAFS